MSNINYGNIQEDLLVKQRVEKYGCFYDLAGNRYAYIQPTDNVVTSDADGFLFIDSQRRIYEEVGRIDPLASPKRKNELEAEKIVLETRIERRRKLFQQIGIEEGYTRDEVEGLLKVDAEYQSAILALNKVLDELKDVQRRRNIVLEEQDPTLDKVDYIGVYSECKVDEAACELLVNNVGPGKVFSKGLVESWFNGNRDESKAKSIRLRPYIGDLPILSIPWPENKIQMLQNIHGQFYLPTSLIGDDQLIVATEVGIYFPDMIAETKSPEETAYDTLYRGIQKVKEIKRTM